MVEGSRGNKTNGSETWQLSDTDKDKLRGFELKEGKSTKIYQNVWIKRTVNGIRENNIKKMRIEEVQCIKVKYLKTKESHLMG